MRELLARHALHARHALGQHFLVDDRVYERIVAEVGAADDDWVVEIGAGLGTLTRRLCALVPRGKVVALERDPRLHAVLAGGVAANSRLRADLQAAAVEEGVTLHVPPPSRCTDNAAMVAAAGYHHLRRGERAGLDLNAVANLPLPA